MPEKYSDKVEEIIGDLKSAKNMVSIGTYKGIRIEATMDDGYITFHNNLGGFNRPSKMEAVDILNKLKDYYSELCDSSMSFKDFVGNRQFKAELYVFSGQMDFPVAVLNGNEIDWNVKLD